MSKDTTHNIDTTIDNGVDIKNRTLFLDDEIDSGYENSKSFMRGLHILETQSLDPITVKISCPGGDVYTGLAMYDALRASNCPVTTVGYGIVASMASIVFLAGSKRLITPSTKFMVHSIQTWFSGSSRDLKIEAEEIKSLEELMYSIYVERTDKKDKKYWKQFDRSKYFTAKECLDLGIADGILDINGGKE